MIHSTMSYIPRPTPKTQQNRQNHNVQHRRRQEANANAIHTGNTAAPLSSRHRKNTTEQRSHRHNASVVGIAADSFARSKIGSTLNTGGNNLGSHALQASEEAGAESKIQNRVLQPAASVPANVSGPPTRMWFGLSKVKTRLPAQSNSQDATRLSVPLLKPWGSADLSLLARSSIAFWKHGRLVDFEQVAYNLNRSPRDTRVMLQLMLQEYMLYARKSHWSADQSPLIRSWAAKEYPSCRIINPGTANRQRYTVFGAIERCFSYIMCREPDSSLQGSPILVSEQELDGNHNPQSLTQHHTSSQDRASQKENLPLSPASLEHAFSKDLEANEKLQSKQPTEPKKGHIYVFTAGGNQQNTDACCAESTGIKTAIDSTRDIRQPVAIPRKSVNLMSRNSRRRRQRKRLIQEPVVSSSADPRASAMTTDSAYASVGGGPATKDILATCEATTVESNVSVQPISHSAMIAQYTSAVDGLLPDAELSPELSKDTHDISRLDGDIDMQFFDVVAAHRKYIRGFVEMYIQKYFGSFYYRVAIHDRQASRLCQSLNAYFHARQSISDANLLAAIEKKMAALDATYFELFISASDTSQLLDLNSSDRHFHMSLLAAVQECKIYEDDDNWPSADAYATAFFNRIIEDVQFILFEGHQGTFVNDRISASSSQPESSSAKDIAARITPFKRAYYLGILASILSAKYIEQMGRRVFLERAQLAGYRPVPTDVDFDNNLSEEDLEIELGRPSSDVAIRGELHSMIMEMMPYTTNESTMIAMQRAIEVYNRAIVDYVDGQQGEIKRFFANDIARATAVPNSLNSRVLDVISRSRGTMNIDTVCMLARWLSELWFDRLKDDLLNVLLVDRQLRPVSLNEVRRWIFEDHSPNGRCFAFTINTRLYNYLKHMRVLMNETKWLFASAAATLRAIELLLANLHSNCVLLRHVSVEKYAQTFGEFVTNNSSYTGGIEKKNTNDAHATNIQAISQTPDFDNPHKRLEALTGAPVDNAAGIQRDQPHIQMRINALEMEVADIRKTMREMAGMHHDIHEVLTILKSNNFS